MSIPPWVLFGSVGLGFKAVDKMFEGRTVRLTNSSIRINGFVETLLRVLSDWNPGKYASESEYQDSMVEF